jgi:hypothetical protein
VLPSLTLPLLARLTTCRGLQGVTVLSVAIALACSQEENSLAAAACPLCAAKRSSYTGWTLPSVEPIQEACGAGCRLGQGSFFAGWVDPGSGSVG